MYGTVEDSPVRSRRAPAGYGWLVAALLLLFAAPPVHALDGGTIDRWMDAMSAIQKWSEGQEEEMEMEDALEEQGGFDFGRMMARSMRQNAELSRIIQRHGFRSPDAWGEASGRIFNAFAALQMEKHAPEMEQQMAEALRRLDENPHMTAEQKAQMRQQMQQQMGAMPAFAGEVPEADLRAVKSREAALRRLFEEER